MVKLQVCCLIIILREDLPPTAKEYLNSIKSSGDALLTIINDILDFSKIESGKMEIIEAAYEPMHLLHDLRLIFLNRIGEKDVELQYDITPELPQKLYGDDKRLRQIIINLMNNAIKFTDRGYVRLHVEMGEIQGDQAQLRFFIEDTGQGIREEDIGKLFGSFQQVDTKKNRYKEGTGLGLAICKQLVDLMHGEIGVKSTYGEGSTFYFTIPQKILDKQPAEAWEEKDLSFVAPNASILVVDDNAMNRKVALGLMAPYEMQIDTAENGKQALQMIRNKYYDIVLMDHMMPVMDGIEATEALRKMDDEYFQKLVVIALSANATSEAREQFLQAQMNDFVSKPIRINELAECLLKWLPEHLVTKQAAQSVASQQHADLADEEPEIPQIDGLDVSEGIQNCGSRKLYLELLGDFYKLIGPKSTKLEKCLSDGMLCDFTIEVHALKNTARMIGAKELSELFYKMEQLGNARADDEIKEEMPHLMKLYHSYQPILQPFARAQEKKKSVSTDQIEEILQRMHLAVDNFDLDGMDAAMKELEGCELPEELQPMAEKLGAHVADVAMEDVLRLTDEMCRMLHLESR